MRTAILGGKGQLGRELCTIFAREGSVATADLPRLNIADADAVAAYLKDAAPDLVLNAAAYTDVEAAEDHRQDAFSVNEIGARNIARAAAALGAPVVYYSTDYVFSGDHTQPYAPDDPVAPRGVYAESKAAGEAATREETEKHFIIRTAWLYGPGGNNFVEKILRLAASQPALKVVEDEVGSPTHTLDLAEVTQALVRTGDYGTYHGVNRGHCSRYEFTREIFSLAGVETPMTPCTMAEFPTKAPRPRYSVLSCAALEAVSGYTMRPWREALTHYMTRRGEQE